MAAKTVKAATLTEDLTIYPRHQVNEHHIRDLSDAIRSGATMPAIVVERGTGRIVDGFHRRRAAIHASGDDATIEVIERVYPTEAALFADAMRLNSGHGAKLSAYDIARCTIRGEELGLDEDQIASALSVTKERMAGIQARKIATAADLHRLAIKNTAAHLAGETITADQERGMRQSTGMNPMVYVNQTINLLQHDLINWENERLVGRLRDLYDTLGKALAVHTGVPPATE